MVACPSEQHLTELEGAFNGLLANYNSTVALTNRRTGGLGQFSIDSALQERLFSNLVCGLAEGLSGPQIDTVGFNDNSIRENPERFLRLFPDAKLIAIFRHPLCCAESAWEHNCRLAEQENSTEHTHIMRRFHDYDGWVRNISQQFASTVARFRDNMVDGDRLAYVKYEDLRTNTSKELGKLLQFLQCDPANCNLAEVAWRNSFDRLKQKSPSPHFFRSGALSYNKERISQRLAEDVMRIAGDAMDFLQYPIASPALA